MNKITVNNLEQFATLIPKTLDAVITENRHLASLALASDDAIAERTRTIAVAPSEIKDTFADWRLVAYNKPTYGVLDVLLVGYAERQRETLVTSNVQAIDLTAGLVITRSGSVYQLKGDRGIGEPPVQHLVTLCGVLHRWGAGKLLGVLPIFF